MVILKQPFSVTIPGNTGSVTIVDLCEENINFKCSSWDLTIIDIIIDITIDIVACYTLTSCKADNDNQ